MDDLFVLLAYTLICAIITSIVAYYKNYSPFLWFILGLFFPVIALVVIIFFKESLTVNRRVNTYANSEPLDKHSSSSAISKKLIAEEFIGEREISNDAYKIYLVKKYKIEKNLVLDSFILKDKLFKSIDEALSFAHSIDNQASNLPQQSGAVNNQKMFANALAKKYNITYDGEKYHYKTYEYNDLLDAIAFAKADKN